MHNRAKEIIAGNVNATALLIRDIENDVPSAREILKELYPYTGKAYVIGITGAPGVGKSTLIDQMVHHLRELGKTVGVVAVDPSSPFGGGAILGDRIRMQRHDMDRGVFIKSLGTRGHFGGLTKSTRSAVQVLDAMGKDYIIVETVGVGQDEVDVFKCAHTTIVVTVPGLGDRIQAVKAGLIEVGNIFVVNKGDERDTEATVGDLTLMANLSENAANSDGWKPPIVRTQAVNGKGIEELFAEIERHRSFLEQGNAEFRLQKRRGRVRDELIEMVKNNILQEVMSSLTETPNFEGAVEAILNAELDPYSACDGLVQAYIPMIADQLRRKASQKTDELRGISLLANDLHR